MRIMGLQEKERLIRDIKRLNKDLGEIQDRCSMLEVLYNMSFIRLILSCMQREPTLSLLIT